MTLTLHLPNIDNLAGVDARTWGILVGVLVVALLASIAVELIKRKYSASKQVDLAKHWTAVILTASASLFTLASYFIAFAQNNASFVSAFPFLARHMPQAVGVAYFVYNIRLSKWYQNVANVLGKWSSSADAVTPPQPVVPISTPSGTSSTVIYGAQSVESEASVAPDELSL